MKKKKLVLMFVFSVFFMFSFSVKSDAAIDWKISTVVGKVYQDSNKNGEFDLKNFEIGVKGQPVSLFPNIESAQQNTNAIKTTSTNAFGDFSFSKLKKGIYYLRYGSTLDKYKLPLENDMENNIVEVKVDSLLANKNLPLNVSTSFNVVPFVDVNWNGTKEDDEALAESKSFLVFNVNSLKKAIEDGSLANINVGGLIGGVLSTGNVDLADGVYVRTAKSQNDIRINDASSGLYVVLRSPVNFTLSDIIKERKKLELLVSILTDGDYLKLLDNPEILAGSDIDTTDPNRAISLLADTIKGIVSVASYVDTNLALENKKTENVIKVASQVETFLRNLPSFRIGMVDYFGNMYDLTGLRVRKANTFYFGIREFANVELNVFYDKNSNGKKDFLEFSNYETNVNLLNENGEVVDSASTTSKSGQVKFENVPYNTDLYVEVVADRATTTSIMPHELPAQLQGRAITNKVHFDSDYLTSDVSYKIGVIGDNYIQNNIGLEFMEDSTIKFTNSNKKTNYTVVYYLNGSEPMEFNVPKKDSVLLNVEQEIETLSVYLKVNNYLVPIPY